MQKQAGTLQGLGYVEQNAGEPSCKAAVRGILGCCYCLNGLDHRTTWLLYTWTGFESNHTST